MMAKKPKPPKKSKGMKCWFPEASLAEIIRRAALLPPPRRLYVVDDGDDVTLSVKPEPGGVTVLDEDPPVNESHRCPPFTDCP